MCGQRVRAGPPDPCSPRPAGMSVRSMRQAGTHASVGVGRLDGRGLQHRGWRRGRSSTPIPVVPLCKQAILRYHPACALTWCPEEAGGGRCLERPGG